MNMLFLTATPAQTAATAAPAPHTAPASLPRSLLTLKKQARPAYRRHYDAIDRKRLVEAGRRRNALREAAYADLGETLYPFVVPGGYEEVGPNTIAAVLAVRLPGHHDVEALYTLGSDGRWTRHPWNAFGGGCKWRVARPGRVRYENKLSWALIAGEFDPDTATADEQETGEVVSVAMHKHEHDETSSPATFDNDTE